MNPIWFLFELIFETTRFARECDETIKKLLLKKAEVESAHFNCNVVQTLGTITNTFGTACHLGSPFCAPLLIPAGIATVIGNSIVLGSEMYRRAEYRYTFGEPSFKTSRTLST